MIIFPKKKRRRERRKILGHELWLSDLKDTAKKKKKKKNMEKGC